jgi:Beta protein
MNRTSGPIYVPALRFKQGEYQGLRQLSSDVADLIIPRLIMPPPKERDQETKRFLTKDDIVYGTGRRIGKHWPMREAFLEPRYLYKEFGVDESKKWLPLMFKTARDSGARAIALTTVSEVMGPLSQSYRQVLAPDCSCKIAIRVESGEIDGELESRLLAALNQLGIQPPECTIVLDFADADFSNSDAVADIAHGALEDLQRIGLWRQIVFQGTNYPEKNPAEQNGKAEISRNEWLAWKKAVKFDRNSSEHLIFGDYGADCAEVSFQGSGGIPIRHYRYTTADSWIVFRGSTSGTAIDSMKSVCGRILESGKFAGRNFSAADDYIYMTANGWAGPGNGTTWREINTAHHITRVVRDIGAVKGMSFRDLARSDPGVQQQINFEGA